MWPSQVSLFSQLSHLLGATLLPKTLSTLGSGDTALSSATLVPSADSSVWTGTPPTRGVRPTLWFYLCASEP